MRQQRGLDEPILNSWILHREERLDTPIQIALHHVGAPEPHFLIAVPSVAEVVDSVVLQESAHDADDADILAESGDARYETAASTDDQVDLHAFLACLV